MSGIRHRPKMTAGDACFSGGAKKEPGTCGKCGRPKLTANSTVASGFLQVTPGYFCACVEIFESAAPAQPVPPNFAEETAGGKCAHCDQLIFRQGRYKGWDCVCMGYWFSRATGSHCPKSEFGHERILAAPSPVLTRCPTCRSLNKSDRGCIAPDCGMNQSHRKCIDCVDPWHDVLTPSAERLQSATDDAFGLAADMKHRHKQQLDYEAAPAVAGRTQGDEQLRVWPTEQESIALEKEWMGQSTFQAYTNWLKVELLAARKSLAALRESAVEYPFEQAWEMGYDKAVRDLRETSPEAPAAKEACSIDLIVEMEALLDTHCENGGCDQEDCGCPGSRLRVLVIELRNEFGELTAPAVTKEK